MSVQEARQGAEAASVSGRAGRSKAALPGCRPMAAAMEGC